MSCNFQVICYCFDVLGVDLGYRLMILYSFIYRFEVFQSSRFINWIGVSCDIPCKYGYQIRGFYGKCKCDRGFWGQHCDELCPGGLVKVCSGHGRCLSRSGICRCKRKWRGALDCSRCTAGYVSKDCSVAIAAPNEKLPMTSVFGTGYYVTLDGVKINVNVAGEFRVLDLPRYGLNIQFRQVRVGNSVRLRCAIVRVRETVVAIHSSIGGASRVLITRNGLPVNYKTLISFGVPGFIFQRSSLNSFTLTGPGGLNFVINSLAMHFDVSITMDRSLCREACGLLGRCRESGSNPLPSNCTRGGGLLDTYPDITTITQDMLDSYVNKWAIPRNESSFGPILNISGESPSVNGGSCLFFNGTSIVTPPITNVFISNYITVQFFVKAKDPRLNAGTIISYAFNETFAITVNGTIRIYFGAIVVDTKLTLETELWNHISFVYKRSTGLVQLYLVNAVGVIQTRVFYVGVGIFPEGGTLSIALWQITSVSFSVSGFVGWVDELSFWNKRFDSVMIQEIWNTNLQADTPGIALLWKFDEGNGFLCRATVGSFDFDLAVPPFRGPAWYPSDAVAETTAYEIAEPFEDAFDNTTEELCSKIFQEGSLYNECFNATGGSEFYFDACVEEVSSSRNPDSAITTAIAFAEECQAALNLSHFPYNVLCSVLPPDNSDDVSWPICTPGCLMGWYSDGACRCDSGYWGVNCSNLCPGGAENPCFGNGQCITETGKCECHPNWEGDENCSTCTPGWKGPSCSVAVSSTGPNNTFKLCTISESGYVTGFDGSLYTFKALGEFVMIRSSIIEAQVRQVPCQTSSVCINAIGVKFNELSISVHAPYDEGSPPLVYANNKEIAAGEEPTKDMLANNVTIVPTSNNAYRLVISHHLSIQTVFRDRYLTVESTATESFCKIADGLCGSCFKVQPRQNDTQGNGTSVFPEGRPTTVLDEIGGERASDGDVDGFIRGKLSVGQASLSAIVLDDEVRKETRIIYGGIYSLYFRFTAVVTRGVVRLFEGDTVTLQLLVKSCDPRLCGGTLVSYTSNVTFYISNHITVKVVIGLDIYDTGIATEADVWNQISVVFVREKLELFVFITFSSGLVQVRKFEVTIDPFIAEGTFAIGMWQPASGTISVQPKTVFIGQIDEICVWKIPFDYALIQQSWRANIQPNASSLMNLWKFNEGENAVVKDLVSGVELSFPRYPLGKPDWVFSDAPIASVVAVNPNKNNATLQGIATQVCFEFIFQGPIYSACKLLGNMTIEFYFRACVEAVVDTGSTVQSIDAVITLSDYCQKNLGLTYFPAQPLCNKFPGKRFPNWIGANCTTPCVFGKASNISEVCECDPGFYGVNCSGICPGGKGRACNNHGICDVVTGKCLCELNWRGNENCTACSTGWTGNDCSTAVTRRSSSGALFGVGAVSIGGHFASLSGISYSLHVTGEYYLIHSVYVPVVVQVRLVACYQKLTCINSIALKLASHKVVLHGPYTSAGSTVVWLNGKVIDIDVHRLTAQTYGFEVKKITAHLWEVKYTGLYLKIRVTGRYLSLSTNASGLICKSAIGLLGSCNQGLLESLLSYSPNTNCSDGSFAFNISGNHPNSIYASGSENKTQDVITSLIVSKLRVKACHSLFEYVYKGIIEYREANTGYALYFDHTTVVSGEIYKAFVSTDITINIMFKTVRYGVIVSYTATKTFFVTNSGGAFVVYFGDNVYPTNIAAELTEWNQISLVFRKSSGVLQFYYFSSGGQLHRLDINIGFDIFVPGGIIAFAGWMPSLDGSGIQPTEVFAGFIDEVRIWTRYFHPAFILQTWNRSVSVGSQDIAHTWKFNEGEGIVAVDKVTGMSLELSFKPWKEPEWRYSDVVLQMPFYEQQQAFPFANKTFQVEAELFCNRTLLNGPLYSNCDSLGLGVAIFYFRSCLQRIASFNSLYVSLEVIIAYADYCQAVNNLTLWPAKPLCNEFPGRDFPIWFGKDCDRKCIFGKKIDFETCICHHGYWGSECASPCPGGAATPCNNNGMCDSATGKCECHANYNGTEDCSACSSGWTGADCSLALVIVRKVHVSIAVSSTGGHYVTFDGYSFTLVAVGEYYLLFDPSLSFQVQVRHVPCRLQSVCVNALGIRIFSTVVSFHAPYISGGGPVIWVNGKVVPLSGFVTVLGDTHLGVHLEYTGSGQYLITWRDNFAIHIRIHGRYLSFKVDVKPAYCANSTGLLGSCDNNPDNDLTVSSNSTAFPANISQPALNSGLANHGLVLKNDSLIVLKYEYFQETRLPSGGVYALVFNHSGASSRLITKAFTVNVDITIEILLKPYELGGTIFSYAVSQTFAVLIENSLTIRFGNTIIITGVSLTINQWSHISLIWYHKTQALEFYHFDSLGKVTRRSYVLSSNPFMPGGVLSVGQWEISPGQNDTFTDNSFVGIIDEFRVWKRAFNPSLIQQNWRMNVLPSHPDVAGLWKINEGEGDVIKNAVTDEHIYLPKSPWQRPLWIFSDAEVRTNFTSSERPFETHFHNKTLETSAKSFCLELFFESKMYDLCYGDLKAELEFYFLVCLKDAATSGNIRATLAAVVTFSDHCHTALNLTIWPGQRLCNKFPGRHFPLWIGDNCDIKCVFGTADPNDRNLCVCTKGYWRSDCSQLCPGGLLNTCGGHGVCDSVTGQCSCDPNWRGDENCTTCAPGWLGRDCSVIVQSPNNNTAGAHGLGYLNTLDGTGYKFLGNGEYHMILSPSFEIQTRMITCFSSSSCFNAVAVRIEQHTLLVHARFTVEEEPFIYVNGKAKYSLEFNFGPANHNFIFSRTSRLQFVLSSTYGVRLMVRLYDRYLDIHLRVDNQTYCQNTRGLWGNCNLNARDDFISRDGEIVSAQNVTQTWLHDSYGQSWLVQAKDSLFHYDFNSYHEQRVLSGGGYALHFKNTGAHTKDTYSFSSSDLTIEFMVRAENLNGTLISYSSSKMFAVILETGKIKLRYEDTILDTLAIIELKKWNHFALVWSASTRILQFYHIVEAGVVHNRNFPITSVRNVFQPGGILALGYSQPAADRLDLPLKEGFVGQIDELRIWNIKRDRLSISASWKRNLDCTAREAYLSSLWKFNEGFGTVAFDCISSARMTFQSGFWHGPTWVFSTAPIRHFSIDVNQAYSFRFGLMWMNAEQKCYDLVFRTSLTSQYTMLNTATLWFYHMSCVASMTRSSNTTYAYWPLLAMSDFYQLFHQHSVWFAQRFCGHVSSLNIPVWYGLNCQKQCKYGLPVSDNCVCMNGFYGFNCSQECPGGYYAPCDGHSQCSNITGKCNCPFTSNVTDDCSLCSQGWIGADCSVARGGNYSNPDNYTCQGFGATHYTTFDGAGYTFGTYGEFYLLKSNQFTAQVRQIPCMSGSFCISAVAVKTGSSSLVIRSSHNGSGDAMVWFNGKLTEKTRLDLENGYNFYKVSPQAYEIVNKAGATISFIVKDWQRYLSFEVTSIAQLCIASSGLCSSCDSNIENVFTNSSGTAFWGQNISQRMTIDILSSRWRVANNDSLFLFGFTSYNEHREITSNGYALHFNGTVASSGVLHASFVKDFTLQFFIRTLLSGGTILSYAKDFTFAIVNDAKVKVYVGRTVYDVGIALPMGSWVQVSITYSSAVGMCIDKINLT